jgi:hypothetical protein
MEINSGFTKKEGGQKPLLETIPQKLFLIALFIYLLHFIEISGNYIASAS